MDVITQEGSELLDRLTRLAYGNTSLVSDAIKANAHGLGRDADLADVVDYIVAHRA